MNTPLYAGIELGGTKTICVVGRDVQTIEADVQFATGTPSDTLAQVAEFLMPFEALAGIGIGAFGPININPDSAHYGHLQNTPKAGWSNANILAPLQRHFHCPITLDTDVNAAALAEYHCGNGQGLNNIVYVTVGTGIGGGVLINGQPVSGLSHPEMGHIALPRVAGDEAFTSSCPFHAHCAEGLASGTAVRARWQAPLNELATDHRAWDYQAEYLAEFFHSITVLYSPQRIICGGGVTSEELLQKVRLKLFNKLNGYVAALAEPSSLNHYLCLPELGNQAGPTGSLLLAQPTANRCKTL